MPANTGFKPAKVSDFEAGKLNFFGDGWAASTSGAATNFDYAINDDMLITGGNIWTFGATFGDYMTLQILDTNGTFTGQKGYVLNTFVNRWYVGTPVFQMDIEIPYPAKILAGMSIRLIYTAVGSTPVNVISNFNLHKVLV